MLISYEKQCVRTTNGEGKIDHVSYIVITMKRMLPTVSDVDAIC